MRRLPEMGRRGPDHSLVSCGDALNGQAGYYKCLKSFHTRRSVATFLSSLNVSRTTPAAPVPPLGPSWTLPILALKRLHLWKATGIQDLVMAHISIQMPYGCSIFLY